MFDIFGEASVVGVVGGDGMVIWVVVVVFFVFFTGEHMGWEAGEQGHFEAKYGVGCGGELEEDEFPYLGREPRQWVGRVFFGLADAKQQGDCLWVAWQL